MTVNDTTTLTSDRSTPAIDASSPPSDDVDQIGDLLLQPTAGRLLDCMFVDINISVDNSLDMPSDIWRCTTETDGHGDNGHCVLGQPLEGDCRATSLPCAMSEQQFR